MMKKLKYILVFVCVYMNAQIDPNYPEIDQWQTSGKIGGIPTNYVDYVTITPIANLQASIDAASAQAVSSGFGQIVNLSPGTYDITLISQLQMRNNVMLRGSDKATTIIYSSEVFGDGGGFNQEKMMVEFDGVVGAGLEDLTLKYFQCFLNIPKDYWTDIEFVNSHSNSRCGGSTDIKLVRMHGGANNNWVDNCWLIDSGTNPIQIDGDQNTISNCLVDGSYKTGPGGDGYFLVTGDYNLIIYNRVTRIRHFSFERGAQYNVAYGNIFEVDINYHNGDDGYNLCENNVVYPYLSHGFGPMQTGRSIYGHDPPDPSGNYLFRNSFYRSDNSLILYPSFSTIYHLTDYADPDGDLIDDYDYMMTEITSPLPVNNTFYPSGINTPALAKKRVLVYYNGSEVTLAKKQTIGAKVDELGYTYDVMVTSDNLGAQFNELSVLNTFYEKVVILNETELTVDTGIKTTLDNFTGNVYYVDATQADAMVEAELTTIFAENVGVTNIIRRRNKKKLMTLMN
ncbi:MAG: hypothetical protein AAF039_15130 [Bacteroidota bacterium]